MLGNLTEEEFSKIEKDFFYITAKKFAKVNSIEKYSQFAEIMNKAFGFDSMFLKAFLAGDRDHNEIMSFIKYIKEWKYAHEDIVKESVVFYIEKFASYGKYNDFLALIVEYNDLLNAEEDKKEIFFNFIQILC